jgi:hypothetical protein
MPTIEIRIHAIDRRGNFATTLGGKILCARTKTPFLDSARRLIEVGHDPQALLVMFREGKPCLLGRLGDAASLTVDQERMRFVRWKAFPSGAVGPPVRETRSAGPQGHDCGSQRISAEVASPRLNARTAYPARRSA